MHQLETFLAVAEERSFSRAAVRMHRTQPAISQVIRKLEESVGEVLLDRAARAIARGRSRGGHIGYVRVAFEDEDFDFPESSRMGALVRDSGGALHADSPTTAIDERVAPAAGDVVVRKTRVGAFSTTDLHDQLQDLGVDTLVLAGISTSGVVLSTVIDAHDLDYRVFVLADGCFDWEAEVHTFLLEQIFPRRAAVITLADLPALLSRG